LKEKSTRFGEELNKEILKVQHPHAPVVSCMVENDLYEPVIGLSFDGTGLGDDDTIWGSEFLVAENIKEDTGINHLALSGGTFQNRYLLKNMETMLSQNGYKVSTQNSIPCYDGGIALGQLAIATRKFRN